MEAAAGVHQWHLTCQLQNQRQPQSAFFSAGLPRGCLEVVSCMFSKPVGRDTFLDSNVLGSWLFFYQTPSGKSCLIHPIKLSSWLLHSCGQKLTSEGSVDTWKKTEQLSKRRPGFTDHSAEQLKATDLVPRPTWVLIPAFLALSSVPGLTT